MVAAAKTRGARGVRQRSARDQACPKPVFEEAVAPSAEWREGRESLLGYAPEALRARLEHALAQESDGPRRSALERCLRNIPKQIADADIRLAMRRFRDALARMLKALPDEVVVAAKTRERELEHKARSDPRSDGYEPRLAFARMIAALPESIRAERDRLTADAAAEPLVGEGRKGGRPQQVALTELAQILDEGGYSHAETSMLLETEVEQRLRRRRNASEAIRAQAERDFANHQARKGVVNNS